MSCIFDQLVEIVAADQKMRLQEITNNRLHQPAKPDYQSIERELECERKNSEALNARLRAFETSTSWRVTAGVRAIAKALAALGVRR
jgi:hypothetical protein